MHCIYCDYSETTGSHYKSGVTDKMPHTKRYVLLDADGDPVCSVCQKKVDEALNSFLYAPKSVESN
jgi:hypothetical protein